MIMTVFSTMKMPMEFVISSAFLTPFSFPENDAMHPVPPPLASDRPDLALESASSQFHESATSEPLLSTISESLLSVNSEISLSAVSETLLLPVSEPSLSVLLESPFVPGTSRSSDIETPPWRASPPSLDSVRNVSRSASSARSLETLRVLWEDRQTESSASENSCDVSRPTLGRHYPTSEPSDLRFYEQDPRPLPSESRISSEAPLGSTSDLYVRYEPPTKLSTLGDQEEESQMRSLVSEKDTNIVRPPLRSPRLSFNAANLPSSERSCPTSGGVVSVSWIFPASEFDVPLVSGSPQPSESSRSIRDPEISPPLICESPLVPTGFPPSDFDSISRRTAPLSLDLVSDISSTCFLACEMFPLTTDSSPRTFGPASPRCAEQEIARLSIESGIGCDEFRLFKVIQDVKAVEDRTDSRESPRANGWIGEQYPDLSGPVLDSLVRFSTDSDSLGILVTFHAPPFDERLEDPNERLQIRPETFSRILYQFEERLGRVWLPPHIIWLRLVRVCFWKIHTSTSRALHPRDDWNSATEDLEDEHDVWLQDLSLMCTRWLPTLVCLCDRSRFSGNQGWLIFKSPEEMSCLDFRDAAIGVSTPIPLHERFRPVSDVLVLF